MKHGWFGFSRLGGVVEESFIRCDVTRELVRFRRYIR